MSRNSVLLIALLAFMMLLSTCAEDPVNPPRSDAPRIPTKGLLAFYPFNGDVLDASGNENTAMLLEGASVDKYLTIGDNARDRVRLPYTIFDGMGDFTVSVWARITTLHTGGSANHTIIGAANSNQWNMMFLLYDVPTSSWVFQVYPEHPEFGPSATITDLEWHHVVAMRNGALARFYLDNQEIGDGLPIGTATIAVHPNGLLLGQEQDGVDGGFDQTQSWAGDLDNLRIYNRALSVSEINLLYKETGWGG